MTTHDHHTPNNRGQTKLIFPIHACSASLSASFDLLRMAGYAVVASKSVHRHPQRAIALKPAMLT